MQQEARTGEMTIRSLAQAKNRGIGKPGKLSLPRSLPNLSLIGVPEGQQNRAPGVMSYPDRFNPDARNIWKEMFQDEMFVANLRATENPDTQWHSAIIEFLKRCEMFGAVPFINVTHQEQNDAAMSALSSARISLKKYVDGIGLFDKIKIFKACREYKVKERGLEVTAWADVRPVLDPYFEKWLVTAPSPRFTRSTDLKYVKMIQPNVTFWVRYVNSTRITIGYEIQVASPISVPGKRLATRKEIDNFVDRVIWLPIVRTHRFIALKGRLF